MLKVRDTFADLVEIDTGQRAWSQICCKDESNEHFS